MDEWGVAQVDDHLPMKRNQDERSYYYAAVGLRNETGQENARAERPGQNSETTP